MTTYTHILGGVLASFAMHLPILPGIVGAVVHDADRFLGLPAPSKRHLLTTHRGFTHHILVPAVLLFLAICLKAPWQEYMLAFTAGYASHIVLDALTPLGVPYSFGYYPRLSLKLFKTGGKGEIFVILSLIALLLLLAGGRKVTIYTFFGTAPKTIMGEVFP